MPGGSDDRNAPQWSEAVTSGHADSLDGTWYSRWDAGTSGTATVRVVGDRFYAMYSNLSGRLAGRTWLLDHFPRQSSGGALGADRQFPRHRAVHRKGRFARTHRRHLEPAHHEDFRRRLADGN
jgi:hypothetical protein